jgi:hypothetical protein
MTCYSEYTCLVLNDKNDQMEDKLEEAVQRIQHFPTPTVLRRGVKGTTSRGIPLTGIRDSVNNMERMVEL